MLTLGRGIGKNLTDGKQESGGDHWSLSVWNSQEKAVPGGNREKQPNFAGWERQTVIAKKMSGGHQP